MTRPRRTLVVAAGLFVAAVAFSAITATQAQTYPGQKAVSAQAMAAFDSVTEPTPTPPPTATPAPTPAPTLSVTINTSSLIVYGKPVKITGTIVGGTSADLIGESVTLRSRAARASAYKTVASTTLVGVENNEYAFTITPAKNATYYVQFKGNGVYLPVASAVTTVNVAFKVTLKRSAASVRCGKYVTLSGLVLPKTAGNVAIRKKVGTNWAKIASARAGSNGVFRKAVKLCSEGTFYLQATRAATSANDRGSSNVVKVVVKKRA